MWHWSRHANDVKMNEWKKKKIIKELKTGPRKMSKKMIIVEDGTEDVWICREQETNSKKWKMKKRKKFRIDCLLVSSHTSLHLFFLSFYFESLNPWHEYVDFFSYTTKYSIHLHALTPMQTNTLETAVYLIISPGWDSLCFSFQFLGFCSIK